MLTEQDKKEIEESFKDTTEVAGEWVADLQGVLEAFGNEEREDMRAAKLPEEAQDNLLLLIELKALHDCYERLLAEVEEEDVREHMRACVEKSALAPLPPESDDDGDETPLTPPKVIAAPKLTVVSAVPPVAPKIK